jgi:hypothetical protein
VQVHDMDRGSITAVLQAHDVAQHYAAHRVRDGPHLAGSADEGPLTALRYRLNTQAAAEDC